MMLRSLRWFLSINLFLLLLWSPVAARQAPGDTRIIKAIPKGPAVTLTGIVTKDKEVVYVLSSGAGLKFNGRLTKKTGNTGFNVTDPDGLGLPEEECDFNTSLTGSLEKTGDYKVTVTTFEDRASPYALVIRVY
ncbi:MAG: hypothetical protein ABSE08_15195 [Syntrophobacteraceae bacterium]